MVAATIEAPTESQPKQRISRAFVVDGFIAVLLFTVALIFRRHFPSDGLFFDDAWQALGAVEGSLRQLVTVGQTQPGFTLELMVWSRLFGHGASTMVVPAMIAGALGPPALYLVLRKFGYAVSIALLLGSALAVCETAITYSGRVKSYTFDLLVILLLCVLLPWLAKKRWGTAVAAGWFVGAVILATFSSFALLAVVCADLVLVLYPRGDRKIRVISVGAQAAVLAGVLAIESGTHDDALTRRFFDKPGGYIKLSLNPVTFGGEVVKHLQRVMEVFPGGPGWLTAMCVVVAAIGLVYMARSSNALVGRFLVLMVLVAMAGSVVHRVPFGPMKSVGRVTIWLIPVVAFGIATVLQRVYRAAETRSRATRVGFNAVAFGFSALLLASAVGVPRHYPAAGTLATQRVMAEIRPDDVVLITRPTIYTFALDANTPVRLVPVPTLTVGFLPHFTDKRLHPLDFLTSETKREIDRALKDTNRVYVVDSLVDPVGYENYRADLAKQIGANGFKLRSRDKVGTARVSVWQRPETASSSG